jgi:hypothetical protein
VAALPAEPFGSRNSRIAMTVAPAVPPNIKAVAATI